MSKQIKIAGALVAAALLLQQCGEKRENLAPTAFDPAGAGITYTGFVAPVVAARCGACHIGDQQGGVGLGSYAAVSAAIDRVIARAEAGTMPPSGYIPFTPGQLDSLRGWVAGGKTKGTGTTPVEVPVDTTITFSLHIGPLITRHCDDCHIGDAKGGISLATYQDVKAGIDRVIARCEAGSMPPPQDDFLPLVKAQIDTLKIWRVSGERP